MKHLFTKPVSFEGVEYTEIEMNLEELTGKDISQIKRQWAGKGNFSPVPAADMDFQAMAACHAASLPHEFADALPAKEYTQLCTAVGNFLMASD